MNGSGRVALVTGAGSGIGRATARRLAADGYRVALVGRRAHALKETAADVEGALVSPCDVTDHAAVRATVATTLKTFGRLDVVVNNAGISATAPFAEVALERWREVMAVDVESVVVVTQAALPALLEHRGCVVNVASLAGLGGDPKMTIYNAAEGRGGQPDPFAGGRARTTRCARERRGTEPHHHRCHRRHPGQ